MAGKKLACLYCAHRNRVPFDKLEENPKCGSCGKGLMPNKAVDITAAVLDKARANDDVPLIVDFWAPWCGPCVAMAPEFNKAAKALAGKARLVKVNTQTHMTVSGKLKIKGIPTMIAWRNGREINRHAGALKMWQIINWVPAA
jgi:thioredoxin 2